MKDGGVEMRLRVNGTTEVVNWLLGFGGQFEVIEPIALRDEIAKIAARMHARHGDVDSKTNDVDKQSHRVRRR
jgi:predicted DNA-binding transcriptional regulator YafY